MEDRTMKKTYIQPSTEILKVKILHMVCVSNANLNPTETITSESEFGARESGGNGEGTPNFNLWEE